MNRNEGFIQLIIILVLFVVILSLLGVSLSALFQDKTLKENFSFVWNAVNFAWQNWLMGPVGAMWDFIGGFIVDFIWKPVLEILQALKRGENPFYALNYLDYSMSGN